MSGNKFIIDELVELEDTKLKIELEEFSITAPKETNYANTNLYFKGEIGKEDIVKDIKKDKVKKKIYNTNVEVKREYFDQFVDFIKNQFEHGGDKYKVSEDSDEEMTDMICRKFPGESGVDWALGLIDKYTGRFKNFQREKDLFKIATFAYIIWLKCGFHLNDEHDEDIKKEG